MTRTETPASARAVAWGASALLVLWWTLLPFTRDLAPDALSRAVADIQWVPFVERGRPPLWSDIFANLALFLPFGFLGWRFLQGRRLRLARLLGAALTLSLIVEVLQLALPARRSSATDVVVDGLGALLGAGIGRFWELRGREAVRGWLEAAGRGEPAHALVALWAVCLALWALLPGPVQTGSLWNQTQGFASSFRRFPGWSSWLTASAHLALLGAIFSALVTRTGRGKALSRAAAGAAAAVLLGFGLEALQLLAPGRRADIFQALAFGAGGLPGSLVGLAARPVVMAAAGLAVAVSSALAPAGGLPEGETRAVLLFGAAVLGIGAFSLASGGETRVADPEPFESAEADGFPGRTRCRGTPSSP